MYSAKPMPFADDEKFRHSEERRALIESMRGNVTPKRMQTDGKEVIAEVLFFLLSSKGEKDVLLIAILIFLFFE